MDVSKSLEDTCAMTIIMDDLWSKTKPIKAIKKVEMTDFI